MEELHVAGAHSNTFGFDFVFMVTFIYTYFHGVVMK